MSHPFHFKRKATVCIAIGIPSSARSYRGDQAHEKYEGAGKRRSQNALPRPARVAL
jgi:hypothetical protein